MTQKGGGPDSIRILGAIIALHKRIFKIRNQAVDRRLENYKNFKLFWVFQMQPAFKDLFSPRLPSSRIPRREKIRLLDAIMDSAKKSRFWTFRFEFIFAFLRFVLS